MKQVATNSIINFKDLPLLQIFSSTEPLNKKLMAQVDAILQQRLKNEMMISHYLHEGAQSGLLPVQEAAKLHNSSKDSISDLVKIKQLLGGLPTETKAVVHTIDTNAVMEAVRMARRGRVLSTRFEEGGVDG